MKNFKFLLIAFLSIIAFSSFAAQDKWVEGFGQGNLEYSIDKGPVKLRIHCPTKQGSDTASSGIVLIANNVEIKSFKIEVGGTSYTGPFYTGSRVDDNNFVDLFDKLQKSDAKVTYGKNVVVFPKSNVAAVVPKVRSKDFSCNIL
jgi:hypothetical protein